MLKIITDWLEDKNRKYSDGIVIFETLGSTSDVSKFLPFFKKVDNPGPHDIQFTILVTKVSEIARNAKVSPKILEGKVLSLVPTDDNSALIAEKNNQILALKLKLDALKTENEQLIADNSDLEESIDDLEHDLSEATDSIESYESQIADLETEIDALKAKRGLQIVALKDMPEDIRKKYERNQQITPLMGSLHGQISVEGLHHMTRAKLVKQLTDLDDERRQNWDDIESWSEGRETEDFSNEAPVYDADPTVAGAQMARRIERIKENMTRSQAVADTTDKETIKANALKRIEAYQAELDELTTKTQPVSTTETKGDAEK